MGAQKWPPQWFFKDFSKTTHPKILKKLDSLYEGQTDIDTF
jgi:hypothetical protein